MIFWTSIINTRQLVNKVSAVVHGDQRTRVFSMLEFERRGIDGRQLPLSERIAHELTYQHALKTKIPIDNPAIQAQLNKVLQGFNLKPGDEEKIFAQEGYTYEEGFEQFRVMYAVNAMTEHYISQNLFVSEDEIVAYFNAHPIVKDPMYLIQTATIPLKNASKEEILRIKKDVSKYIKTGQGLKLTWSDSFWVKKNELADNTKKLSDMEIGSLLPIENGNSFQLFKLINKKAERIVPLQKRHKKISEMLRKPKIDALIADYKKKLIDNSTIVYLSPT